MAEDKDRKIEELTERITELEASIRGITRPYVELVDRLNQVQGIVNKYFRLLDIYQTHGSISIETVIPQVKDPISKEIVRILMDRPNLNISQVTDELKVRSGSSSRRIVREKLKELVGIGVISEVHEGKVGTYVVSDDVVSKWSQVLGLTK